MTLKHNLTLSALAALWLVSFAACSDDPKPEPEPNVPDANFVGQAVGNFSADEWYPGGELGTTQNTGSTCYQDNTPAIEQADLDNANWARLTTSSTDPMPTRHLP